MSFFELLNLLGSLALFLYGMKVMSDALMELAGDKMRKVMIQLTSNRFKGVLTGLFVTGLIQSSSATTLMVVSFVNAQLLSLTEAISVIMGANIGTTFTAWLIAILGFKVKMSSIAVPLILVGLIFYLKKDRNMNNLGNFIIGFALLFIGLEFMKDAITGLENNPALFEFFQKNTERGFIGIILFVVIGTALTLILQSSSATMAITIVAASQGVLTFEAAAAIVLGENIGTTITANLAAMISGTEARRAALAHLTFNLIGVIWILILFVPYLTMIDNLALKYMSVNPMVVATDIPIGLSLFHSSFNVINTFILIWFIAIIARLVIFFIPEKIVPEPVFSKPKFLSEQALSYPETAIKALLEETRRLYQEAIIEAIAHGLGVHRRDIKSDKPIDEIVKAKSHPGIKLKKFIETRIQPIYTEVLNYASTIQDKFQLSHEDNERLTRLKKIHRDAMEILLHVKKLKSQISKHQAENNDVLNEEYFKLKCAVIELVRMFLNNPDEIFIQECNTLLSGAESTAESKDVALLLDIDKLIREKKITPKQGVSLITCSNAVLEIYRLLIKAAKYLAVIGSAYSTLEEAFYKDEDDINAQIEEAEQLKT
jgi:phosphate:Na+ symporter